MNISIELPELIENHAAIRGSMICLFVSLAEEAIRPKARAQLSLVVAGREILQAFIWDFTLCNIQLYWAIISLSDC